MTELFEWFDKEVPLWGVALIFSTVLAIVTAVKLARDPNMKWHQEWFDRSDEVEHWGEGE